MKANGIASRAPLTALRATLCATLCAAICSCATAKFEDRNVEWTASFDETANEFELRPIDGTRSAIIGQALASRDGEVSVTVDRIRWFNNWRDGWTEADIDAEGSFSLRADAESPTGYRVLSVSAIELYDSPRARIRYRDESLATADATGLFNRRLGRVRAAVACLRERGIDSSTFRAFADGAGRFLFPEAYGYPDGASKSAATRENRSRAEGYAWDTVYTKERIPEELREIRDSGTLFRDWEEGAELFYFIYTLENLR